VLVISCEVSMPQEVEAAIARTVETFGRLDIAFNNAGVENKPAPLAEIELDEWDRILTTCAEPLSARSMSWRRC
jgi:NAD(P)-dependent dehydrogenase (short-subunit alcohol dehydrogenase family)